MHSEAQLVTNRGWNWMMKRVKGDSMWSRDCKEPTLLVFKEGVVMRRNGVRIGNSARFRTRLCVGIQHRAAAWQLVAYDTGPTHLAARRGVVDWALTERVNSACVAPLVLLDILAEDQDANRDIRVAADMQDIISSAQGSLERYAIIPSVLMTQSVHTLAVTGGLLILMRFICQDMMFSAKRRDFLSVHVTSGGWEVRNSGKKRLSSIAARTGSPVEFEMWLEKSGVNEFTLLLPGDH